MPWIASYISCLNSGSPTFRLRIAPSMCVHMAVPRIYFAWSAGYAAGVIGEHCLSEAVHMIPIAAKSIQDGRRDLYAKSGFIGASVACSDRW